MMLIQSTVVSRLPAIASGSPIDHPVRAAPKLWQRNDWLAACKARLSQLRPDQDVPAISMIARGLWLDVAAFDPVIAAEMEYETWRAGDQADEPAAQAATL
jgi:hypothetical protein